MHERILQVIEKQGINVSKLETLLNVSQGSLRKQLKNKRPIGSDKLIDLGKIYPNLNMNWLLKGDGEMYTDANMSIVQDLQDELQQKDTQLAEIKRHREEMRDMYNTLKETLALLKNKNA